jgi:hypothetical protein
MVVKLKGFLNKHFNSGRRQNRRYYGKTLIENEVQTKTSDLFESNAEVNRQVFGKKVGIFVKLFGCGHQNLSRPFSHKRTAYRACLQCGARKQFDTQTLKTFGDFYNAPKVLTGISSRV